MITEKEYCSMTDISHRKRFAQYFTPGDIAEFRAKWVMGESNKKKRVLEPAFGLGIFSRCILKGDKDVSITGFDIDTRIFDIASSNFSKNENITLHREDYLTSSWRERYDCIICNPPYMKFHDYDNRRLIHFINEKLNQPIK